MQIARPLIQRNHLLDAFREHKKVNIETLNNRTFNVEILLVNELGVHLVTFFGKVGEEFASGYFDYQNDTGGFALDP